MNAGARLALSGVGLVAAFGIAFGVAAAVAPDDLAADWQQGSEMDDHGQGHAPADGAATPVVSALQGLALSADGFVLSPIDAPAAVDDAGTLSFRIEDAAGDAVTEYTTAHDRDLHLIIARSDGSRFQHVHPVLDESTGIWSLPWEWAAAGTYRVFADFTPAGADASGLTLSRTVQVAGEFTPVVAEPSRVDEVDGFTVSLDGDLAAGASSELAITVSRDGQPVTALEPYLGAFGHLVALRDGDLAFLHVHAEGDEPQPGETAGPEIGFVAEAPTAGRYLLYLDFRVDGEVRTAEFVLDAGEAREGTTP
ncbi:hypothetical protein SRABI76_02123 [Microbacterium oxydans]|uniref:Heavy metal-binding domain-containing protein n=1 Tax=Microbacterium oxydans TaxID=82380 RepID=A0A0F0LD35_9MICO|nr:hypothetical protein [Microbacterium oxydans]KJL30170.1 hypothetical protein RS83_00920 [Microbacterium oxydans]CAH0205315.1 hypothetical protein SRABI76_02123 [Microbacterium oxydans]